MTAPLSYTSRQVPSKLPANDGKARRNIVELPLCVVAVFTLPWQTL